MNDTSPEVERLVREKIMARTGEERFVMGAQMFDAAREMIRASFPADLSKAELKLRLFERIYGESTASALIERRYSPALVREKPDNSSGKVEG